MPQPAPTSRRTALCGLLATGSAWWLAGCDLGEQDRRRGSGATTARPDADQRLIAWTARDVARVALVVATAGTRHPPLRPALGALTAMHRTHLAALGGAPTGQPTGQQAAPVAARGVVAALLAVRAAEAGHQRRLEAAASRAASGTLARLLASMSAGVSQHLAALPSRPPDGRLR